jgi:hypothetical protein
MYEFYAVAVEVSYAFSDGPQSLDEEPAAILEAAAVFILAPVRMGRKEALAQVAVGEVQDQRLEPDFAGALALATALGACARRHGSDQGGH